MGQNILVCYMTSMLRELLKNLFVLNWSYCILCNLTAKAFHDKTSGFSFIVFVCELLITKCLCLFCSSYCNELYNIINYYVNTLYNSLNIVPDTEEVLS